MRKTQLIKINTRTLICGLSGSGKTNALTQFILLCNGVFDKLYLCYKTDEPFYEMLIDQLKEDDLIEVHRSLSSFSEVNDFEDAAAYKRRKEKAPKYLVIFDDCINDTDRKSQKKLGEYFTFGRKKNLTICFLSQSYYQTDILFRKQMNYLLLTGISSNSDLKSIVSEYALGKIKAEKLIQIYEWIKENDKDNDLDFMKINLETSPIYEKISRNFTQYIQIDEKQEQPNDAPKQFVEKQKYKKKITKRI
jgi:hypothetical protein